MIHQLCLSCNLSIQFPTILHSAMLPPYIFEQYLPPSSFDFLSPLIMANKGSATCQGGIWIEEKNEKGKKSQGFHRCEILTEQSHSMAGGSLLGQIFLNASLQWCHTDRDEISCGTIIWFISLYQPLLYLKPLVNCASSPFSQFFKHLLCLCPILRMWLCTQRCSTNVF